MAVLSVLLEILRRPSSGDVLRELLMFIAPLWIAVIVGVLVGWMWKPKWAALDREIFDSSASKILDSASSASITDLVSIPSFKFQLPSCISWTAAAGDGTELEPANPYSDGSSSSLEGDKSNVVGSDDLEHIRALVEEKDGGPAWIKMMDRSTSSMGYQAWRRDPETGPPQYRSRTVLEDATPEMVRDFFWDDEFRMKWDNMLIHASILEEFPTTGAMVVHWVRKFPFFCSDREYVIGRRIWDSDRSYYCVTKGVPNSTLPRRNKPKRVDLYYSSWCIRAVESRRGDGEMSACEVLLFHHEDMGIPWEIAKLGVRQGMWGAVKKIEPGLRAYQKERASGAPISRCGFMAGVNTKVKAEHLRSLEGAPCPSSSSEKDIEQKDSAGKGRNIAKIVAVGGAVALAFTLDRGLLTKAVIFGVARRFSKKVI